MNIDFTLPVVAQKFRESVENRNYDFKDDRASSVMDFLYVAYMEAKDKDPVEISDGFKALDDYMEGISLDHNNAIFNLVCTLCDLYEKRAFKDGLQLGAYLILELQGK